MAVSLNTTPSGPSTNILHPRRLSPQLLHTQSWDCNCFLQTTLQYNMAAKSSPNERIKRASTQPKLVTTTASIN